MRPEFLSGNSTFAQENCAVGGNINKRRRERTVRRPTVENEIEMLTQRVLHFGR